MKREWMLVALAVLLAIGGCKRRTKTTYEGANMPVMDPGPTPVNPMSYRVNDDPRAKAMETAWRALLRGDSGAAEKALKLGADMMPVIKQALKSENILAMLGALKALAKIGQDAPDELLFPALSHVSSEVRVQAVDTVALLKRRTLTPQILDALADEEVEVAATACDALLALSPLDYATLGTLFKALDSNHNVIRAACGGTFAVSAAREDWRERVGAMLLDRRIHYRDAAIRVLAAWQDPTSFDLIRGRLADKEAQIVELALASLAGFGDVATLKEVEQFTSDKRLGVRLEAVSALAKLPADLVRGHVLTAVADTAAPVRLEAVSQLARYPHDVDTLLRAHSVLRDEDPGVRSSAAMAIGELKNPRSIAALGEQLVKEEEEVVRRDLVGALAEAGGKMAVPALIEELGRGKGLAQSEALYRLRRITGANVKNDPAAWKAWLAASKSAIQP